MAWRRAHIQRIRKEQIRLSTEITTLHNRASSPPPHVPSTTTFVVPSTTTFVPVASAPANGYSVCSALIVMVAMVAMVACFFYVIEQDSRRQQITRIIEMHKKTCFFGDRVCLPFWTQQYSMIWAAWQRTQACIILIRVWTKFEQQSPSLFEQQLKKM